MYVSRSQQGGTRFDVILVEPQDLREQNVSTETEVGCPSAVHAHSLTLFDLCSG
jgi:hypothetical protein